MMILPSQLQPPITDSVGWFAIGCEEIAAWLDAELGSRWTSERAPAADLTELVGTLQAGGPISTRILVPVGEWTALLTDGPMGTDVGMIPSLAARRLHCRALRAVAIPSRPGRFGATILEAYEPDAADEVLRCRRAISVVEDRGAWEFGETGEPFTFEDVAAYASPTARDRFTDEMLERYLAALGVPDDIEPAAGRAIALRLTGA